MLSPCAHAARTIESAPGVERALVDRAVPVLVTLVMHAPDSDGGRIPDDRPVRTSMISNAPAGGLIDAVVETASSTVLASDAISCGIGPVISAGGGGGGGGPP